MQKINPSINPSTLLRINGELSRTIKFFTLGCKANQYDTQSIRERFLSKGFKEAAQPGQPDYFLVTTGKLKQYAFFGCIALVFNIVIDFLFIRMGYGIEGIAVGGTLLTYF
ncbi:MAG: hypothetical protein Q8O02_03435, partial [Candidatus Omnitrophota bacterium]|nr:hypothetical protein [Candidatus Omnitrophota bacterium]